MVIEGTETSHTSSEIPEGGSLTLPLTLSRVYAGQQRTGQRGHTEPFCSMRNVMAVAAVIRELRNSAVPSMFQTRSSSSACGPRLL
jgi:hypothetical protein